MEGYAGEALWKELKECELNGKSYSPCSLSKATPFLEEAHDRILPVILRDLPFDIRYHKVKASLPVRFAPQEKGGHIT